MVEPGGPALTLRQCATRTGGLVNVNSMIAELGLTGSTGLRYYELLRRVYLVEEIPAWGVNLARAAVRSPKLILTDPGLTAHDLRDKLGERFRGGAVIHTGASTLTFGDRLLSLTGERAEVELLTCLAGPVDRLRSGDPELLAYLRGRSSSEE